MGRDLWWREHSAQISDLAESWKKHWIIRVTCAFQYFWLGFRNSPLPFMWVEDEGTAVGNPIAIYHLTFHDMMEHEAHGVMTGMVLLHGLRANAIERLSFERLDKWNGKTTLQPRWVLP